MSSVSQADRRIGGFQGLGYLLQHKILHTDTHPIVHPDGPISKNGFSEIKRVIVDKQCCCEGFHSMLSSFASVSIRCAGAREASHIYLCIAQRSQVMLLMLLGTALVP